ncbi:hypothetical protein ZWY2020_003446 [Hordeum vulgare]|nr:hypothetical protein ZWY2020_003446 [Hordeum vulgare]
MQGGGLREGELHGDDGAAGIQVRLRARVDADARPAGDLHDLLEEAEVAQLDPHVQPAIVVIDPGQIAWCALDLKFPREETETDWSDWSDGDAQVLDVEDNDCTVVDGGDDDDECNGHVLDEDKNTNSKIICPGKPYPASKAKEIDREWIHRHADRMGEYWDMCGDILYREDDDDTPLPPFPLKLFPPIIALCALDAKCYHCVYKTHDTSTTPSILGYREPQEMLQLFSMRLSSSALSYPVSVYGKFAVRDDLDQRRNYVFNCPRDAAVEIVKQVNKPFVYKMAGC